MGLEKVKDILREAKRQNTAVLAFDAMDYATIGAVILGAEAAKKPVIVMLYPEAARYCSLEGFLAMVKQFAEKSKMPVGLHLDHCSDYAYIVNAMKVGFTSVMADGSMWELEENIAFTSAVVKTAKVFGADVEGELGHVGKAEERDAGQHYTVPKEAKLFAEATEVTSLAVAFGSAHGYYVQKPKLDIERLKAINEIVKVPLVLHGGSGIPEEQLESAFKNGINKFNVGTELSCKNQQYLKEYLNMQKNKGGMGHLDYTQQKLTEYILQKCSLSSFQIEKWGV